MPRRAGLIQPGVTTIVEPTSGNTGIALAWVAAAKGYRLILTMPESMSLERRVLLLGYGAELVLTPASEGMSGAVRRAEQIVAETPNAWMPQQFENPANPEIHRRTTAVELWEDTDGRDRHPRRRHRHRGHDHRRRSGAEAAQAGDCRSWPSSRRSRRCWRPGQAGPHKIQGIGANFVPDVLDREIYDEIVHVDAQTAIAAQHELMRKEGLLCGISVRRRGGGGARGRAAARERRAS